MKIASFFSLLCAAAFFAGSHSSTAAVVSFSNANVTGVTTDVGLASVGTVNIDPTALIDPASITYDVTGLTLDTDGTLNDSLSVTLSMTADAGVPVYPAISGTDRFGVAAADNSNQEINGSESLTITGATIVATLSGGTPYTSSFDYTSILLHNFNGSEGFNYRINGGALTGFSGNGPMVAEFVGPGHTSFFITTDNVTPNSKGRVQALAFDVSVDAVSIPEPSSFALVGLVSFGIFRRRRR